MWNRIGSMTRTVGDLAAGQRVEIRHDGKTWRVRMPESPGDGIAVEPGDVTFDGTPNAKDPVTQEDWRERMAHAWLGVIRSERNEADAERVIANIFEDFTHRERQDAADRLASYTMVWLMFLRSISEIWEDMFKHGWASDVCDGTMRQGSARAWQLWREERRQHAAANRPKSRVGRAAHVYDPDRDAPDPADLDKRRRAARMGRGVR